MHNSLSELNKNELEILNGIQAQDDPNEIKKTYITRISQADLDKKIKFFKERKIPFRMESTQGRTIVHSAGRWGSWMNKESDFKANELAFIKSVKGYVKKHQTWRNIRNNFKKEGSTKKIKYFYYNKKINPNSNFENLVEIDLKNAYWHTAYAMGLFDEYIYQKGLTVSKKSRLAAIGSFAKIVNVVEFDGKNQKNLPPVREPEIEFLWSVISWRVGRLMAKAARLAGNDFLFFWVDAIFVKQGFEKDIVELFKKAGFQSTQFKCEWVKFEDKKITVKSESKPKQFTKIIETPVVIDGKNFIKRYKTKEWRTERPFPYAKAMTDSEIINLSLQ